MKELSSEDETDLDKQIEQEIFIIKTIEEKNSLDKSVEVNNVINMNININENQENLSLSNEDVKKISKKINKI